MKLLIVFALAAAATAKPSGIASPLLAAPVVIGVPVSTQYHSQDDLGQYSYGYSNAHSAKAEARSLDGITVGGYTYVDPEGKVQTVEYSSDVNGFKVAASNLPVPPAVPVAPVLPVPVPVQDTPEVVEARAKHLEALEAAKVVPVAPLLPVPVVDTPEVIAARTKHFEALEAAKLRSTEVIASIPAYSTVVQSISPVVAGLPTPLVAAPAEAPVIAAKSAVPAEPAAQPTAVPAEVVAQSAPVSTEAPTPVEEATTTLTPTIEAKSAILPAGGAVVPAGVSVLAIPTLGVKSLVAPALPVGVGPVVAAPAAYSINSIYPLGFTSVVSQPAVTAYTAQYVASVPGSVVRTTQDWSPAEKPERSIE